MHAYHIKANGEIKEISPKDGKYFQLEELQEYVGGYITIAGVRKIPDGMGFAKIDEPILVVNEEGLLYKLPPNDIATALYKFEIMVGDVVLCSRSQME